MEPVQGPEDLVFLDVAAFVPLSGYWIPRVWESALFYLAASALSFARFAHSIALRRGSGHNGAGSLWGISAGGNGMI